MTRARRAVAALCLAALALGSSGAPEPAPLELEARIALGDAPGRLDHLAVDLARKRLFVAELEHDSVGVLDLAGQKLLRTLHGFAAPQGVAYAPGCDALVVANGRTGALAFLHGADLERAGELALGSDADDLRLAPEGDRVWVGYGSGGLAEIDCARRELLRRVPLPAHPEGFVFVPAQRRVFVNLPEARGYAAVDTPNGRVSRRPNPDAQENFPLAFDDSSSRVLSAYRKPPQLAVLDSGSGERVQVLETCGDADDLFVDSARHRAYVVCGEGAVDTFAERAGTWKHLARTPTVRGARTGLFVPELDRLFVAVRAGEGVPAAIWVLRPR